MKTADVLVIGAGPCGLFQVFELGLLGLNAIVVEALEQPGGQCAELYPQKPIFDIPAIPEISGAELTQNLLRQIAPFDAQFCFGERIEQLEARGERFWLRGSLGSEFDVAAVVIAAGAGAFKPVRLKLEGIEALEGQQLFYSVRDRAAFAGKDLVIFGGGDSALDWVMALETAARSLVLVHRSERFRAQPALVEQMRELCHQGRMRFVAGRASDYRCVGGGLSAIELTDSDGKAQWQAADSLLVFFGMVPDAGPVKLWGLAMEANQLRVDTERFETSLPGVFAVGDINTYPGKKKLILSGFHEAALAAFAIKARLEPGKKVQLQYTTTSPLLRRRLGIDTES
ncbi:NAD(P)/FAD-dependent oxidoreductase [Marinobacterium rhizophilum]|uniref:Ferredoxin--NADP reductase n=1 Tax=Marinobacterium rhizophilum TaxID=420402 RepID=A0ABY5HP16_9GAMM|nr:NAD(P)/FAD-dependent oxidoreductase [Marinobacterium rhizophilum]UTW13522.1 NAD(P)/FAD-dependent oxidoreductase [Marinobacterium rhizophilum]